MTRSLSVRPDAGAVIILVVEDDAGDFGLIQAYVRRAGFLRDDDKPRVVWAKTLAEGLAAAARESPDLVLLDLSLPDSAELQTVEAISAVLPDTPIVVLTGRDDDDLAIAALEAGAQDYLVKGQFDHVALGHAVRHALVRKQMEDALRRSEERYRSLLDSVASGVVVHGADTSILLSNPAAASLLGLTADQMQGKTAMEPGWGFVQENGAPMPLKDYPVNRVIASGEGQQNMIVGVPHCGRTEPVWVLCNASPLRDEAGRMLQVIVTLTDISERKHAEQQLAEMAAGIKRQLSERTQQLRAVSAQLTKTEERERRMLAQDLHDNLGQLLAVIKIKLTSLGDGSPRSSVKHIVELVDDADRATRAVTQQLSSPILHALGLTPALEWLAEELGQTYKLIVHFDTDGATRPLADEVQTILFRSVRELLINVARHAGAGEAGLSCLWDANRLILVVTDDGCGFDPSGFLDAASGPLHFGLKSMRERMANIGGEMEIDSSPGNGATITLSVAHSAAATGSRPS